MAQEDQDAVLRRTVLEHREAKEHEADLIRKLNALPKRWLKFEETEIKRTQEFILRWSPDGGRSYREIVRQQWNFSPPETERETEDYAVELSDVTALELSIVPDKSGGEVRASLECLRLG